MKNSTGIILEIIKFLLVILFIYAGFSKLLESEIFKVQLAKSPLLPTFSIAAIAYGLPVFEVVLAISFFFSRFEAITLLLAFFTMLFFTLYLIALNVFFSGEDIPCSCGGILGKLPYSTHIVFNIIFTLLSLTGFIISKKNKLFMPGFQHTQG